MSTEWGERQEPTRRPPGRPRDQQVHRAVLEATLDILAEKGWSGLTMEGVAARARTAKGTVYRWWSSKVELVIEALVVTGAPFLPAPDTGSFRGDYEAVLDGLVRALREPRSRLVSSLLFEASRNPELGRAFRDHLTGPRREHVTEAIARGIERGELRPDVDVSLLADAGVAQVLFRFLLSGDRLEDDLAERITDQLLRGVAPR